MNVAQSLNPRVKRRKRLHAAKGSEMKKNLNYPQNTNGTKLAGQLRAEANKLSEAEREKLFKQGMQLIYGSKGTKEKAGSGH